jgi:hypothetical protein
MSADDKDPTEQLMRWIRAEVKKTAAVGELKDVLHPAVEVFHHPQSGYGLRLSADLPLPSVKEDSKGPAASVLLAEMPRALMLNPNTTRSAVAPLVPKAGRSCVHRPTHRMDLTCLAC